MYFPKNKASSYQIFFFFLKQVFPETETSFCGMCFSTCRKNKSETCCLLLARAESRKKQSFPPSPLHSVFSSPSESMIILASMPPDLCGQKEEAGQAWYFEFLKQHTYLIFNYKSRKEEGNHVQIPPFSSQSFSLKYITSYTHVSPGHILEYEGIFKGKENESPFMNSRFYSTLPKMYFVFRNCITISKNEWFPKLMDQDPSSFHFRKEK